MPIYTKQGDSGNTRISGGETLKKNDGKIELLGSIDELSSFLGLARTEIKEKEILKIIDKVQHDLFLLGARVSGSDEGEQLGENDIKILEDAIDKIEHSLPLLEHFIAPGGGRAGSLLHVSRAVCRRVERVSVSHGDVFTVKYLNRLGDALFMLARAINSLEKRVETVFVKKAPAAEPSEETTNAKNKADGKAKSKADDKK